MLFVMHYAHDMPCASAYLWESAFTAFKKKKKIARKLETRWKMTKNSMVKKERS